MLAQLLAVGAGSCIGGVARYLVAVAMKSLVTSAAWPVATFAVNVAGCMVMGLICGLSSRGAVTDETLRLFLTVGFCGGFTTFSTFANENILMLTGGRLALALGYTGASLVAGLGAAWLGYRLSGN